MNDFKPAVLAHHYRKELLEHVLPFWELHSIDRRQGGYFTCLGRDGSVYDTDKFIWLQSRQVWTFSMLFNRLQRRKSWLSIARGGATFLRRHGRDPSGKWYFALNREGQPLVQPYNIFSDCFAVMAFAQYSLAAEDGDAGRIALQTYRKILQRQDNPKGKYSKVFPGTRPLRGMSLPMILANLSLEIAPLLGPRELERRLDDCVHTVMDLFLDRDRGVMLEHVLPDGSRADCFEGRLLNPGHGIEAMWFILDIARRRQDRPLIERTIDVMINTLDLAWDRKYGGIFYFLDVEGHPPQALEWDQKLWWVHCEALVALLKGYVSTGRRDCLRWFLKVHDYTWSRFPDRKYGEWWGYLNRQGEVLLPLKGGKWKGCFHVPRALFLCMRELEILVG